VAALSQLTAIGASHSLETDPAFQTMRTAPPILAVVAHSRSVLGSWANSRVEATIGPADFFAEGVARGADGSFYLTGVRHGRVVRRLPGGREVDLLGAGETLWAVSGIGLAPDGQSVWVSSNAISQRAGYDSTLDGRSELVRLSVSGGVMRRVAVPSGEAGAMIGDLLVMPDGGVYGSDTRGQAIWYLEPGGSEPRVVARHPLVRSPQGLVPAGDGSRLLVADYSHGILMVDPRSGAVEPLSFPEGTTLLGIDGLARHGRDLIAIQNGGVVPRVLRLRLDAAETRIVAVEVIDRNIAVADEPTLGVVMGDDFYYVANSQWEKRTEDGTPRDGVALVPAVVLRLPLR
jgi:sugar lactone lactonase YvrE